MTYLDPRSSPRPPRRRRPQQSWQREGLVIMGVVALFLMAATWVWLHR
jgi:hypothetical protein